ncbi:MAG: calcium-binding protein [Geminicoccaceae bacterium]
MAIGTNASETVTGTNASETINGLRGDDLLRGLLGNDTYLFRAGDGQDSIFDTGGVADSVRFDASVARSSLRLMVDPGEVDDLFIYNDATGQRVEVDEQFNGTGYRVESITFANGNAAIDLTKPLTFTGTAAAETMYGTIGNDTIIGRGGVDSLQGFGGDDIYRFGSGDGQDSIFDTGGVADSVRFDASVVRGTLLFSIDPSDRDDLFITNTVTGSRIEIDEQFNGTGYAVETLYFADSGPSIDLTSLGLA